MPYMNSLWNVIDSHMLHTSIRMSTFEAKYHMNIILLYIERIRLIVFSS